MERLPRHGAYYPDDRSTVPTSNCTPPTSPALAQTEAVTSGDSTMTVARKTPTRRRPTLSDVMPLTEWLAPYVGQVDNVHSDLRQQCQELCFDVRPRHSDAP